MGIGNGTTNDCGIRIRFGLGAKRGGSIPRRASLRAGKRSEGFVLASADFEHGLRVLFRVRRGPAEALQHLLKGGQSVCEVLGEVGAGDGYGFPASDEGDLHLLDEGLGFIEFKLVDALASGHVGDDGAHLGEESVALFAEASLELFAGKREEVVKGDLFLKYVAGDGDAGRKVVLHRAGERDVSFVFPARRKADLDVCKGEWFHLKSYGPRVGCFGGAIFRSMN